MKRILLITRGGEISGSQRQILYLIENLDRSKYQPIVICNKDGNFIETLNEMGTETAVWTLPPWRKLTARLSRHINANRLYSFAKQKKISLIHCCDLWLNGYMLWATERLKVPSISHVRVPLTPRDVQKHRCDEADKVIAISKRIQDNLLTAGIPAQKIVRIDDSVNVESFSTQRSRNVLREQYAPTGEILIGIVGRIDEFKRQLDFLKAAKEIIHNTGKSVTFFIVGGVHCESYFKKMCDFITENGMEEYIRFTGQRGDMPEVIGSLDILVSLSGGSVMFEAMAAEKAVISAGFSTKEYSVHLQDGKTGLLLESKEITPLANAIKKLIDNPQLRIQLGTGARQWAMKELAHTAMASKTQLLYDSLLDKA